METDITTLNKNMLAMAKDIALIKQALLAKQMLEDDEGELTDWAKTELARARQEPRENYTSLEELEAEILVQ